MTFGTAPIPELLRPRGNEGSEPAVKKKRFSVEQIVAVLKLAEMGIAGRGSDPPRKETCRFSLDRALGREYGFYNESRPGDR